MTMESDIVRRIGEAQGVDVRLRAQTARDADLLKSFNREGDVYVSCDEGGSVSEGSDLPESSASSDDMDTGEVHADTSIYEDKDVGEKRRRL